MLDKIRAGAAAAALLLAGTLVACDSGSDGAGDGKPGGDGSPAAAGPGSQDLPAALTGQKPDWGRCEAPEGGEAPGSGWECSTIRVPLDYDKPEGETIGIAVIRKKATDPGKRIGSLLFNFGGPGGSGVSGLPSSASSFTKLNSRYDLVSFDPRGVSASAGVRCRDDKEMETAAEIDLTPDTAAEEQAYMADGADFGRDCERRSGKLLPHVSTSNAARDMDLMRHVLGDRKLNYLGFSYGTELGGVYAHHFPGNVGRVVLDAVVDPTADAVGHARNQTTGFQRALENYLKSTGQDPEQGTEKIVRLLERIDKKPLPTSSGRELGESSALTGIVLPLYSKESWTYLTQGLEEAENGSGDLLLAMADSYNDRDEKGHYGTQSHSQRAISCADARQRPTRAEAKALVPEFREISPVFGPFLAWDTAGWCADWPVAGEGDDPEVSAPGADPILVVGTTGDPATPYEGARKMAEELGEGVGVRLTFEGEGHGAYTAGNSCVTSTVDAYLLNGRVPKDGKTCS
ncbi:alpha/beta hydrolase [Streptomyces sp. GC420]|uniref:alpha/beta hydrolase n=1 Tax=Streptomyces sp. GC420 TaxID=2697568 RepID=UPI0014152AE4|nr:alpha/beta hydrolase [Streptomyces sp. GC420]NBM16052.1 alpha/beta fold hydrolase [Streptomyces sp. GC420]